MQIPKLSREAALVELEGYCRWTRVEEIVQFAKRMGFRKIGPPIASASSITRTS